MLFKNLKSKPKLGKMFEIHILTNRRLQSKIVIHEEFLKTSMNTINNPIGKQATDREKILQKQHPKYNEHKDAQSHLNSKK